MAVSWSSVCTYKRVGAEKRQNDKSTVISRVEWRLLRPISHHIIVAVAVGSHDIIRCRTQSIQIATIFLFINMLIKVHLDVVM